MKGFNIGFSLTNGRLQGYWHLRGRSGELSFGNQQGSKRGFIKLGGQREQRGIALLTYLAEDGTHAGCNLGRLGGGGALLQREPGTGVGIRVKLHDGPG